MLPPISLSKWCILLACGVWCCVLTEAHGDEVKVAKVVFAKEFSEQGEPQSPGTDFRPTDKINLKVSLNSRPKTGKLSCQFLFGDQKIVEVSADMATLNKDKLPKNLNAYGLFSLKPKEPFPVSSSYHADVFFNGRQLGSYKFAVVEAKDTPRPATPLSEPTSPPPASKSLRGIINGLLQGTAFVEGEDDKGNGWRGTAWLLDKEKRLLVTNDHVGSIPSHSPNIDTVKELHIYFPDYRNGRVIHDASHYAKNVKPIKVKVIYGDEKRDLCLLQAESLPKDKISALPLAKDSAQLGDRLHSLGGIPAGSEGLWIYTSGDARAVYRRHLATGYLAQTVEADMQTNKGNSGGPVVNNAGELVAVVEGHQIQARSVSMYIDLSEVRSFLAEALPLVEPKTIAQFEKRGERHYESSRYDQALEDFTQILKRDPKNAYAMSSRGWIFYEKDDTKTAMAEFNAAIQTDATMLYAYRGRAMVELDEGEFKKALDDLTFAIRSSTDKEELTNLYNERGVALAQLDEVDDALEDFDRALKADPKHGQAHANRGDMLIRLEKYTDAIQSIDRAIKLEPKEGDHLSLMGSAVMGLKKYDVALRAFSAAIELNPKNSTYFSDRANCYREMERYQEAARDLLRAIDLDKSNDELFNDLGLVFFDAGDYKTAYAQFRAATELDRDYALYWYNRGQSAHRLGDQKQAIEDVTQSIELEDDPDAYALRGHAYSADDQHARAKEDFNSAVKLAEGEYRHFTTKFLQIANKTEEPLKVFVRYFVDGSWQPATGAVVFEFAPGELAGLTHGQTRVNGSKFRVWAEGVKSGGTYGSYKDKDLQLVGSSGYVTKSKTAEVEVFSFLK